MEFPDPLARIPVRSPDGTEIRSTVHLSRVIDQDNFVVGDYTYASDFDPPEDWATHLAPYLFPGRADRLEIGRFCQIAHGVRFVTAGANHAHDGFTSYPFPIFDPERISHYQPDTRRTQVGHDVWFGMNALVCPGAHIGSGSIVGAGSVVRGSVPAYAVVTGNPARIVRMRFDEDTVARLQELAWWNWPAEQIAAARAALVGADIEALEAFSP